jgi:hypothetical protein
MLLQTNSYVVPKDKRAEHARLLNRFRQTLARFGCEHFEVFEQAGSNWGAGEPSGRYVQMIRFRDKKHHMQVQAAERSDPVAQKLIAEFCELINFPYQQQQGLFAVGFYNGVLPIGAGRKAVTTSAATAVASTAAAAPAVAASIVAGADESEEPPAEDHAADEPKNAPEAELVHEAELAPQAAAAPLRPMRLASEDPVDTTDTTDTDEPPEPVDLEIDLEVDEEQITEVDLTSDDVDLLEPRGKDEPEGRR